MRMTLFFLLALVVGAQAADKPTPKNIESTGVVVSSTVCDGLGVNMPAACEPGRNHADFIATIHVPSLKASYMVAKHPSTGHSFLENLSKSVDGPFPVNGRTYEIRIKGGNMWILLGDLNPSNPTGDQIKAKWIKMNIYNLALDTAANHS